MTRLEQVVGVERTAPTALRHRLKQIEPEAEVVYVGNGKWWLGRMDPHADLAKAGQQKMRVANQATAHRQVTDDTAMLYRVGRLQQEGFRMMAEYEGEPDGRLVKDLEVADYLWRQASTFERWQRSLDEEAEREKDAALKDLTSEDRAKDAWAYWRKGTHAVKRIDPSTMVSGRTRIRSI